MFTQKLRHLNLTLPRIIRRFIMDRDNMDWEIELAFHWPHNRLAIGWDILYADNAYNYNSYILYLGISTITFNIWK